MPRIPFRRVGWVIATALAFTLFQGTLRIAPAEGQILKKAADKAKAALEKAKIEQLLSDVCCEQVAQERASSDYDQRCTEKAEGDQYQSFGYYLFGDSPTTGA